MSQTPVVQLQHATKTIGRKKIVNDLSFDIPAGEVFGFLGPNGAGKTTTIRMMVGLVKISQGDILIKGQSIAKDFKKAIQNVGAIVENPDLYTYLTGYQNLKHYARMVTGIAKTRINEIADLVGLQERIQDQVKAYSLGMRQRLGIAQALLHRPSLLILDEPTNGLDPAGIHELRSYLKSLPVKKALPWRRTNDRLNCQRKHENIQPEAYMDSAAAVCRHRRLICRGQSQQHGYNRLAG